jgi:hypothetical protein
MIKATLVVSKPYLENKIFDLSNPVNGKDNHMFFFYELKKVLEVNNIFISTQDIHPINESEIIFYNDMPKKFPKRNIDQKIYLFAMESVAVKPENFNLSLYKYFDKVFTWYEDFINEIDIIKINYSFNIKHIEFIDFNNKQGFLCMVSGNKFSNHKYELYTERIKLIEFLENNKNYNFDLYGTGWDDAYKNIILYNIAKWFQQNRLLRKILFIIERSLSVFGLSKIYKKNYKSFKGMLSPKIPKISEYKFNICYENVNNIPGYITEKLFDCFFAGCIPIYLGAPDILKFIPNDTFIDRNKFKDNSELLFFLNSISFEEYSIYQKNILNFLNSEKANKFSSEYNANLIVSEITSK